MSPDQSRYIGSEQCPKCREAGRDTSKDNLHRWEDHAHCFACNYHEFPDTIQRIERLMEKINPDTGEIVKTLELPNDAQKSINYKALQWLDRYGIMREEIVKHDLRWSDFRQWLIFPIYGDNGLIGYQGRNFGPNGPKWESRGDLHSIIHIVDQQQKGTDPLVIVEDIVSAIKVGRQFAAMPIFGGSISLKRVQLLKHVARNVVWWLDADKYPEAIRYAKGARLIGVQSKVVFTERDPKDHTDEEIRATITAG